MHVDTVHTRVYMRERQSYKMFCPGALIESQLSRLHFKGTDVLTLADQACSGKISQSYRVFCDLPVSVAGSNQTLQSCYACSPLLCPSHH